MNGLIQKSGYIKPGSGGGHYAEYIFLCAIKK